MNFNPFLPKSYAWIFILLPLTAGTGVPQAFALGEVRVGDVHLEKVSPGRYIVKTDVTNTTSEVREVVLRTQVAVFDATSPQGDVPLDILRKDQTVVLRPNETRPLEVHFVGEGTPPREALRIEPMVRIRRQRPWPY